MAHIALSGACASDTADRCNYKVNCLICTLRIVFEPHVHRMSFMIIAISIVIYEYSSEFSFAVAVPVAVPVALPNVLSFKSRVPPERAQVPG